MEIRTSSDFNDRLFWLLCFKRSRYDDDCDEVETYWKIVAEFKANNILLYSLLFSCSINFLLKKIIYLKTEKLMLKSKAQQMAFNASISSS